MEQAFVEKVMAAAAGDAKSAAKKQAQHDALVATIKDSDEGAAADEVETKRKVLVALAPQRLVAPWSTSPASRSDLFGRAGWGARYDALADEGRWDRLLFGNALKPLDRADARVRDEFRATLKATAKFSAAFRAKVAEAARHMPMSLDKGSLQMPAPMSLNGDGFFRRPRRPGGTR
ncbi:RNA polymerase I-specific transcription initiation factor [Aureococcus anophagefferens]|nr:RNA polymerase I-specific transcription initiation factor [Aureococcus anophagefferens]